MGLVDFFYAKTGLSQFKRIPRAIYTTLKSDINILLKKYNIKLGSSIWSTRNILGNLI